jgi:hypothetical protein
MWVSGSGRHTKKKRGSGYADLQKKNKTQQPHPSLLGSNSILKRIVALGIALEEIDLLPGYYDARILCVQMTP